MSNLVGFGSHVVPIVFDNLHSVDKGSSVTREIEKEDNGRATYPHASLARVHEL